MKRKWRIAVIGICAALLAGACAAAVKEETGSGQAAGSGDTKETAAEAAEHAKQAKLEAITPAAYGNTDGLSLPAGTYLSVIGKGESGEYWKAVREGAEAAVDELNERLGYTGSDKIKVVYSGPAESGDVDGQVNLLDEELARYPSALGISVIDSQSCNVQFDLATQNGIPIVTFDSAGSYQGIMASIMTDNAAASATAADHMAEALKEEGQVLVLGHDSKSTTSKQRAESFAAEIQNNHPGVSTTEIYYMDQMDDLKKQMAQEQAGVTEGEEISEEKQTEIDQIIKDITDEDVYDYILQKNPDISGIYATSGETVMKALDACERLRKNDLTVMGYDLDSDEQKAIEDGRLAGVVLQNPYGMGYATVVAEARCVLEMGNEAQINTGYTWVTPDNIDDVQVQRLLYAN